MTRFNVHEQEALTATREMLRGKILFDRYENRKLSQVEKLLFCIKHRNDKEEINAIVSGKSPQYKTIDKAGWENGHLVDAPSYEEYLKTCD